MNATAAQNTAPSGAANVVSLDQYRHARQQRQTQEISPRVGEIAPFFLVWMPLWYVPVLFPAVCGQDRK